MIRKRSSVKIINPEFSSPPRPSHDDGPRLQNYKQHLMSSIEKRATIRQLEDGEVAMTEINKRRKNYGMGPV